MGLVVRFSPQTWQGRGGGSEAGKARIEGILVPATVCFNFVPGIALVALMLERGRMPVGQVRLGLPFTPGRP